MAAKDDLSVVDDGPCGCGKNKVLRNRNTGQRIRATISITSNPNPGNYPQQRVVLVEAGGETSLGCDCLGGGGTGPIQYFGYTVRGASYA